MNLLSRSQLYLHVFTYQNQLFWIFAFHGFTERFTVVLHWLNIGLWCMKLVFNAQLLKKNRSPIRKKAHKIAKTWSSSKIFVRMCAFFGCIKVAPIATPT